MKPSAGDRLFYGVNYIVLILLALSCLLPFVHLASVSLSGKAAVDSGHVWLWPVDFQTAAYRYFFTDTQAIAAFRNSLVITLGGVGLSMLGTIAAAYPLSRSFLAGRRFLILGMVFTMMFSGGMIPTYMVVKSLSLIDSYWAIWLTGLVSTYNLLLMKSYFEHLPKELEEAAQLDGCGDTAYLIRVALPLSGPMLATIALFYGVHYWNSFMSVLMYINKSDMQNLTVIVQAMQQKSDLMLTAMEDKDRQSLMGEMIKAAGVIVLTVPMVAAYPFLQRYFIKGIMLGSVKG
ncbi:carbohydrate ABC transporter permease [Paenibacillus hamazuiensis]|uniref:carbohydrate ABC transporter permease n=1 Tax=Paenibacillus hamazuiensis TaxID=2936508 RepID=UPI00201019AF|nr:carbohydrate ABC transporter permease [Paenibacillus hamazuiensis]